MSCAVTTKGASSAPLVTLRSQPSLTISGCAPVAVTAGVPPASDGGPASADPGGGAGTAGGHGPGSSGWIRLRPSRRSPVTACSSSPGDAWLSPRPATVSRTRAAPACEGILRETVSTRATRAPTGLEVRCQGDGFSSSPPGFLQSRRGRPPAWGRPAQLVAVDNSFCPPSPDPTSAVERRPGHARPHGLPRRTQGCRRRLKTDPLAAAEN